MQARPKHTMAYSGIDLIQVPFSCERSLSIIIHKLAIKQHVAYTVHCALAVKIWSRRDAEQVLECRASQNSNFLGMARDWDLVKSNSDIDNNIAEYNGSKVDLCLA